MLKITGVEKETWSWKKKDTSPIPAEAAELDMQVLVAAYAKRNEICPHCAFGGPLSESNQDGKWMHYGSVVYLYCRAGRIHEIIQNILARYGVSYPIDMPITRTIEVQE